MFSKIVLLINVLIPLLLLFCSQSNFNEPAYNLPGNCSVMRIIETEIVKLQWDYPQECETNVSYFEILYRNINNKNDNNEWTSLGIVNSLGENQFLIKRNKLFPNEKSLFEFAVRYVNRDGETSDLVMSTGKEDDIGDNENNWYILW